MSHRTDDLVADLATTLPSATIEAIVLQHFGIHGVVRDQLNSERDQVVVFDDVAGSTRVVKVSHAAERLDFVDLESRVAWWAHGVDPGLPVALPSPTVDGAWHAVADGRLVRVFDHLPGRASVDGATLQSATVKEYGATVARLARATRGFFHPAADRRLLWHVESRHQVAATTGAIDDASGRQLVEEAFSGFEHRVAPLWRGMRAQVVHADLTLDNLLLDSRGSICGITDFGDLTHTTLVADIAAALASVGSTRTGRHLFRAIALFLDGYTSVTPLEPTERVALVDALAVRLAITVTLSASRSVGGLHNAEYLRSWDAGAWSMLRQLRDASYDELARAFGYAPAVSDTTALVARRHAVFGSALAPLTYDEPLHLESGDGATLLDVDGRRYIDAYNNVPVVGHAHPRVADAIADQARLLSTNLRYLHPTAIELAERLVASMPEELGLDTVLYLNSGSEATDLAWRIASAATGNTGALVTDFAYHGVTTATTALSPEQWRGGWTPDHVETFAAPRGSTPDVTSMDDAVRRLAARGHQPAALFVDCTYTSDGILVPGKSYHADLQDAARRVGARVVADEVQAGFGRTGEHLWSFVGAGLTPDVVTLGKPMGNGHPVAAVIARRADVEALAAETEFFSTYAGGPVAAAAALRVLDVIDDEGLLQHAAAMGARLRSRLVAQGHPAIREVRGRGLLLGVELDGVSPAAVRDGARRGGVLIGTTGRHDHVLKIRPPLVVTEEQIDRIAAVILDAANRYEG